MSKIPQLLALTELKQSSCQINYQDFENLKERKTASGKVAKTCHLMMSPAYFF